MGAGCAGLGEEVTREGWFGPEEMSWAVGSRYWEAQTSSGVRRASVESCCWKRFRGGGRKSRGQPEDLASSSSSSRVGRGVQTAGLVGGEPSPEHRVLGG